MLLPKYIVSGPAHAAIRWADLAGKKREDWQLLAGREPEIAVYKRLTEAEVLRDSPAFSYYKDASAAWDAKKDEFDSLSKQHGIIGWTAKISSEVIYLELNWNRDPLDISLETILGFQDQVYRLTGYACIATSDPRSVFIDSVFEDYGIVV